MKVRYSKRAVDDLIAVADYIRQYNPSAAEAVEKRIRAVEKSRNPKSTGFLSL